jgi:hypothetical protein
MQPRDSSVVSRFGYRLISVTFLGVDLIAAIRAWNLSKGLSCIRTTLLVSLLDTRKVAHMDL